MTASEAIEALKKMNISFAHPFNEARNKAIEALEKQIPKKPLDKTQEYDGEYGLCPNCGKVVSDYKEYKRCSECSQALNWSDVE